MLEACDVGHRVVVRRRVGVGAGGRPVLTDLLGSLVAVDEDQVIVRSDDGAEHRVARAEVVAAKPVPPRPTRYSEIEALERLADRCWPAPVHERLGDWYLRSAQGWTSRANSALPLGAAGLPLTRAVGVVAGWYRDHGLTPRITVPLPLRRDAAGELASLGWIPQPLVLVQTADLARLTGEAEPSRAARLVAEPAADVLALIATRKQSLPPAAHAVLTGPERVRFAEVRAADGTLLGIARGAVDPGRVGPAAGWLHLGVVEVIESARRAGLARLMSGMLAGWADSVGATRAVLQVEQHNTAAATLYRGLGFSTHHTYVTYRCPD